MSARTWILVIIAGILGGLDFFPQVALPDHDLVMAGYTVLFISLVSFTVDLAKMRREMVKQTKGE